MQPKSVSLDLLSSHDVMTHLHNEFVCWVGKLEAEIKVLAFFAAWKK